MIGGMGRGVPRVPTSSPLAERLYDLRIHADLTQELVGYRTGVHFTTWSGYERGVSLPNVPQLRKFVEGLGLPIETFHELVELRDQTRLTNCVCDFAGVPRADRRHVDACSYSRPHLRRKSSVSTES